MGAGSMRIVSFDMSETDRLNRREDGSTFAVIIWRRTPVCKAKGGVFGDCKDAANDSRDRYLCGENVTAAPPPGASLSVNVSPAVMLSPMISYAVGFVSQSAVGASR